MGINVEKSLHRALVPWEIIFRTLYSWDDPISLADFMPFALSLRRLVTTWERWHAYHQNQTTNNFLHPVLNDRGLGNGGSFKIAAHFPLWLETNCCNHRMQNEREARHKNAGTNSLVTAKLTELYYLSARPCWKLAVFQIILFFMMGWGSILL